MQDPYFHLLGIYREKEKIEYETLIALSKDAENVGYFDHIHGIPLKEANEFLKKWEFIKQTEGKADHYITEKGKNYYGVEKLKRDEIKRREDNQDAVATSIRSLNTWLKITNFLNVVFAGITTVYIAKQFHATQIKTSNRITNN